MKLTKLNTLLKYVVIIVIIFVLIVLFMVLFMPFQRENFGLSDPGLNDATEPTPPPPVEDDQIRTNSAATCNLNDGNPKICNNTFSRSTSHLCGYDITTEKCNDTDQINGPCSSSTESGCTNKAYDMNGYGCKWQLPLDPENKEEEPKCVINDNK